MADVNVFFVAELTNEYFPDKYTVSQKKQDTKLLPITSPNINRFSKFFHW